MSSGKGRSMGDSRGQTSRATRKEHGGEQQQRRPLFQRFRRPSTVQTSATRPKPPYLDMEAPLSDQHDVRRISKPAQKVENTNRKKGVLGATRLLRRGQSRTPDAAKSKRRTPATESSMTPGSNGKNQALSSTDDSRPSHHKAGPRRLFPMPPKSLAKTFSDATVVTDNTTSTATAKTTAEVAQAVAELDQKGNTLFEQGKYDEAFRQYQKALVLKRKALQNNTLKQQHPDKDVLASMATSINNMTYLKQRSGEASTAETMASYLKSLQIKRDILGPTHLSVGKTLNNIGSVFYLQGEYDAALKAYQDALNIMLEQLGDDHVDVGTVRSNLGDVYVAQTNKDEEALIQYRQALTIRWQALGKQDPKVRRLMEQVAKLETGDLEASASSTAEQEKDEEGVMQQQEDLHFQDTCRVLQEELEEDLKYFDLVERQMEIDFIRDKTQMVREMRELSEQKEANQGKAENEHAQPPIGITAGQEASKYFRAMLESNEQRGKSESPNSVLDVSKETVAGTRNEEQSETGQGKSKANESTTPMSPEERQRALVSVRARLERLRASRAKEADEPSFPQLASLSRHRSYMSATASSTAKAMVTTKPVESN